MNKRMFYLEKLASKVCQCGKSKKPRMIFCRNCFYRLPRDMRNDLAIGIKGKFSQAYDVAAKHLRK